MYIIMSLKYINRAIMICLCAQRIVNTDHKTHNKIASNSIDFGLKKHYFQNFSGPCPGPRWGAHSAPQTPSWIFHLQTPLNPDPSTLLVCVCVCVIMRRRLLLLSWLHVSSRLLCCSNPSRPCCGKGFALLSSVSASQNFHRMLHFFVASM